MPAVFQRLADATGLVVYSYDCMGHGMSGPPGEDNRSYLPDAEMLIGDLLDFSNSVLETRVKTYKSAGFMCLAGYSMGGMISANVAARAPDLFSVLMLTSPLIDPMEGTPPLAYAIKYVLVTVLNFFRPKVRAAARHSAICVFATVCVCWPLV